MPKSKKKTKGRKNKNKNKSRENNPGSTISTASSTATRSVVQAPKDNDTGSFQYGEVVVDLLLDTVSAFDLMPLRCVNRRTRNFIDRRIFKSVMLESHSGYLCGTRLVPVVTGTEQRLPLPDITAESPDESTRLFVKYAAKYTTVLDFESVGPFIVKQLEEGMRNSPPRKLEMLRLRSDESGLHTYSLLTSLGARTVVVFPSFKPFLGWNLDVPMAVVSRGTKKVVQHVAFAIDWRGAITLCHNHHNPENLGFIKNEVWIMTHAEIHVDIDSLRLWDEASLDVMEWRQEEFFDQIRVRLDDGVKLTLVGLELLDAQGLLGLRDIAGQTIEQQLRNALISFNIREGGIDNLHVQTWVAYTATLSPEQLEVESLPPGYLEHWRLMEQCRYPS